MFTSDNSDEDILGMGDYTDNELLEYFGQTHLLDAVRILASRKVTADDSQLIHEALCIVVSMYVTKYNKGEIDKDVVKH